MTNENEPRLQIMNDAGEWVDLGYVSPLVNIETEIEGRSYCEPVKEWNASFRMLEDKHILGLMNNQYGEYVLPKCGTGDCLHITGCRMVNGTVKIQYYVSKTKPV